MANIIVLSKEQSVESIKGNNSINPTMAVTSKMLNSEISMKAISPKVTKEAPFKQKSSLFDVNSGSIDSPGRKY